MKNAAGLVGVGIYSVPEASRMTGVSSGRIRRWLRGYDYIVKDERRTSPPVWAPDLPQIDSALALSFRDLIEVRFVDFFLRRGCTWKEIREAAGIAAEMVESSHPFSTKEFMTDGKTIFRRFGEGREGARILKVVREQYMIADLVDPALYKGIEFDNLSVVRWYPLAPNRRVVIDPGISFGQPVVRPEGVPTSTLFRAVQADGSVDFVAKAYEVSKPSVNAAIEYEQLLAA